MGKYVIYYSYLDKSNYVKTDCKRCVSLMDLCETYYYLAEQDTIEVLQVGEDYLEKEEIEWQGK